VSFKLAAGCIIANKIAELIKKIGISVNTLAMK